MIALCEQELIRRAADGDKSAFEVLMTTYQKQVYNLALRMCGHEEDALDLAQESFIRAWSGLKSYRFDAAFSTWLYRLTSNVCIDFLRREKRRKIIPIHFADDEDNEQELSLPDPGPGTEENVLQKAEREAIAGAITQLEPEYRHAFVLRVVNDLSYQEIADVLDIQVGTVKSRIARAREKIRKILLTEPGTKPLRHRPKEEKGGRVRHDL